MILKYPSKSCDIQKFNDFRGFYLLVDSNQGPWYKYQLIKRSSHLGRNFTFSLFQ